MAERNKDGNFIRASGRRIALSGCLAVLLLLAAGGETFLAAQKNPALVEIGDRFGYRDKRGKIVIPARYTLAAEFSKEGIAAVVDEQGWAYINRRGVVLVRPFIFDNGPDYYKQGLARFVEGGKIGFFNKSGKIIIKPQFDHAGFFSNGLAAVCQGCRREKADAEHSITVGGRWGYIDRRGQVVIPLKYESGGDFKGGKAEVKMSGKWYDIDRRGKFLGNSRIGN